MVFTRSSPAKAERAFCTRNARDVPPAERHSLVHATVVVAQAIAVAEHVRLIAAHGEAVAEVVITNYKTNKRIKRATEKINEMRKCIFTAQKKVQSLDSY